MTDHHGAASRGFHVGRDSSRLGSRGSYETGESSNRGSLLEPHASTDRTLAFDENNDDDDDEIFLNGESRKQDVSANHTTPPSRRSRRIRRPRLGRSFLLQDAVSGDAEQSNRRWLSRRTPLSKGKSIFGAQSPSAGRDVGLGIDAKPGRRQPYLTPEPSQEDLVVQKRGSSSHDGSRASSSPQSSSIVDVDSTKIVSMALNLSESRRIASHRNFTRSNPPRLTQIPDASPGGNLKAHLQQQRRTSRSISPRPYTGLTPRLPSSMTNSPLQPAFESASEGSFRYHFSTSTLARAQKAREHLELMAQYRRLLELLPSLKRGGDTSLVLSPTGNFVSNKLSRSGTSDSVIEVGREYNPLQYIRNRKVRARERKAIDGELQGFADVESVRLWVDIAIRRASTISNVLAEGGDALPPFPGAEEANFQSSPDAPGKAALRLRRPRVDWFFEPYDMIADAYWLEQDHHKQLIEDREWRKIFPPTNDLSRPISRQEDDENSVIQPLSSKLQEEVTDTSGPKDLKLARPDTETSQTSAKDRAKQKLHDIKGMHKHSSSTHSHHDFLRRRRGSHSDSGSDDEEKGHSKPRRTRPGRAGTLSSSANDLFAKQMQEMMDMIEQEEKERDRGQLVEVQSTTIPELVSETPEELSQPSSRLHSRKGSITTEHSEPDHKLIRNQPSHDDGPIHRFGKFSIDLPERLRPDSVDFDSSMSASPEILALRENPRLSAAGVDVSSMSSRASSPTRNPFSKVKQIFKDKNRDDAVDAHLTEGHGSDQRQTQSEHLGLSEKPLTRSRSSNTRPTAENSKSLRSMGSIRHKGEDQVGLRGIFKGPRLDTVFRGGVSKLGDMLWRKESSNEAPIDLPSADEYDSDVSRGRPRASLTLSRTGSKRQLDVQLQLQPQQQQPQQQQQPTKHFLDTMPQFLHVSEVPNKHSTTSNDKVGAAISRPHSRQHSRFEALKPPRIDIQSAPDAGSPATPLKEKNDSMSVKSEKEPRNVHESTQDDGQSLDPIMALSRLEHRDRCQSRHWSITDLEQPHRAQISRRELARMHALVMSSGIKAMEISRRANECHAPLSKVSMQGPRKDKQSNVVGIPWPEIAELRSNEAFQSDKEVPYCEHYALASQTLKDAIECAVQNWNASADCFTNKTCPDLQKRVGFVRSRIADDLSGMTREAADQADETSKDLALDQRLKVKHVLDVIEKMMRNRRRRFRWVRRAMWLGIEWVLVGFMWYVWFIVMIMRIFLGIGKGFLTGVRWLLWL